jgi:hypothetical protein
MSEVKGQLIVKSEIEEVGSKGFKKRHVVIKTADQYPQTILVEFIQDKCDLIESYKVGDQVTIAYNLNGRVWQNKEGIDKYFNSVQGWKVSGEPSTAAPKAAPAMAPLANNEDQDLPF